MWLLVTSPIFICTSQFRESELRTNFYSNKLNKRESDDLRRSVVILLDFIKKFVLQLVCAIYFYFWSFDLVVRNLILLLGL
jgi:hypothetical protein